MKIKRLYINNYKSLVDFELLEPNPFSVFVGPNAAGKSNVFEALEFLTYADDFVRMDSLFGGANAYLNKQLQAKFNDAPSKQLRLSIELKTGYQSISTNIDFIKEENLLLPKYLAKEDTVSGLGREPSAPLLREGESGNQWFNRLFSRIFVQKLEYVKIRLKTPFKLALDAENLPLVLNRIFRDEIKKEELTEWMESLVPEFESLQVKSDPISGVAQLFIKEKCTDQYFPKSMISDGTYNILALLTAVYQSDEPQFLCIEEPENGLNPYVVRTLVDFFRNACKDKGHYIWLNTHSATLVRELRNEEIILVDKIDGITRAKQIPHDFKRYDLEMDEAWLTNALGGGLPW
jgi:predicted ATPase